MTMTIERRDGPAAETLYARGGRAPAADLCVPLYRSRDHFPKLLRSLAAVETPFALHCVVDGDAYDPRADILRRLRPQTPVRCVRLAENTGFAHATNVAASLGSARALCLLNADVTVDPGFLDPLLVELDCDAGVAAAGGLQLEGDRDAVHSCGSEYDPQTRCCEHVLRGAALGTADPYLREPGERDVLTGSCLLVRRSAWNAAGGLDEGFRIGYFEDADLCLRLRANGGRIRYAPASVVRHDANHSGAAHHVHYEANRRRFLDRWVETGLVYRCAKARGRDPYGGRVVVCMPALNEEEYIAASLESVYEAADRIVVLEGGNPVARDLGLTDADGGSLDRTVERVRAFPDPAGKITLERGFWPDKTAQRNAGLAHLADGDILLVLDADEVLDDRIWAALGRLVGRRAVNYIPRTIWNTFATHATGVWDGFRPPRLVRFRTGMRYRAQTLLADADGTPVGRPGDPGAATLPGYVGCHYAYVKPLWKLRRKIAFYRRITGRVVPGYWERVFLRYREDPAGAVRRGTHPFGEGGAERWDGPHPAPVARRLAAGALGGEDW